MTKKSLYIKEFRQRRKQEGKDILGGKCVNCGSKDNLEFDHIDPKTKLFNITDCQKKKEIWLKEVQKCQLLCKTCHSVKTAKEHSELRRKPIKHGTIWSYQGRNCRCGVCVASYSRLRKRWR